MLLLKCYLPEREEYQENGIFPMEKINIQTLLLVYLAQYVEETVFLRWLHVNLFLFR